MITILVEAAAITKHCSACNSSIVHPTASWSMLARINEKAEIGMPTYRGACHCGAVTFELRVRHHRDHDLRLLVVQAEERADDEGARERAHGALRRGSAVGLRMEYPPREAFFLLTLRHLHFSPQARRAGSFRRQRVLSRGFRSRLSAGARDRRALACLWWIRMHGASGPDRGIGEPSRSRRRQHKQKRRLRLRGEAAFCISNIERGGFLVLGRPGSDLLSQGLSHSTIGAEAFNGRVRDGIGLRRFARTTRPAKDKKYEASDL